MTTSNIKSKTPAKPAGKSSIGSSPLILLMVLVAAGLLFFAAGRQTPYTPEVTGKPAARIDQEHFDYGDVPVGKMVSTVFHVKNVGDQTLLILDTPYVEVVEGCCPPQTTVSSKRLEPGQEATVSMNFTMHPGMAGYHEFLVHVVTNDPEAEHLNVTVLSNWIE
jgi:hypothetical protein